MLQLQERGGRTMSVSEGTVITLLLLCWYDHALVPNMLMAGCIKGGTAATRVRRFWLQCR